MICPQSPSAVVMIRPHHFCPNPQTAADNAFQKSADMSEAQKIKQSAFDQVSGVANKLRSLGVQVHLFEDESQSTPDSVFPNNWFSTHTGGYVGVYPMYPENRRLERRLDVLSLLKQTYRVQEVVDYSGLELDEIYLEGTGSMVLDHIERIAYATHSFRTSPVALERFCAHFNYEPMLFEARDSSDKLIYHTNVIMCVGSDIALICSDMLTCENRKQEILQRLTQSGRTVIELTESQIGHFCGNALELNGGDQRFLAMSETAFQALTPEQKTRIESKLPIETFAVETLELAGGSIRCMLAGIHLTKR